MSIQIDFRSPVEAEKRALLRTAISWLGLGVAAFTVVQSLAPRFDSGHDHPEAMKLHFAKLDLEHMRDAVIQFQFLNGRLPAVTEGLSVLPFRPTYGEASPWSENCDPWGHRYRYCPVPTSGIPFEVRSAGPDGQPGTADDIVWQ